jgi:RNA polymerase sigma factor (sigma-70 family)
MNGEYAQNESRLASRLAEEESVRLVEAIQRGDHPAEDAFVRQYQARVRTMMRGRTHNRDLAEDLLQDVLLEALVALRRGRLRDPLKLSAFVLAIARNVLNNHFRSSVRAEEPLEFPDDLQDLTSLAENYVDGEREARALEAIEKLEPTDRQILHMTLIDGLKSAAIAEKLGMNPDVVRQRKLRATRRVMEFVTGRSQKPAGLHLLPGRAS